jgi:hypothetical protein
LKASCDIVIEFDNTKIVEKILSSVSVDDFDFIQSKKTGKQIEAHIQSNSVSSLLHTLDDYLACISVASKVLDKD